MNDSATVNPTVQCDAMPQGLRCRNKTKHHTGRCYIHQNRTVLIRHPRISRSSNQWTELRKFLLRRDGGNCGICGQPMKGDTSFDHIIPMAQGGVDDETNIHLTHRYCNLKKGAKL